MSIITKMRKQTAVYWAKSGLDSYGQLTYSTPVEISCRWEDTIQEFIGTNGVRQLSQSVVYVDRDMYVGDILKLGELDSGVDQDTPMDNSGAWEIRSFGKSPNLKNTEYLRTALL